MEIQVIKGRDGWEAKTTIKAIKIIPDNFAAIVAALSAVNGKAAEHCYTRADEIEALAKYAENRLEHFGLPKAERPGANLYATSGAAVPNAYKYSRKATYIVLERKGAGWYLTEVLPSNVFKEGGDRRLRLTKAQDERAVATLRKQYSVAAKGVNP